MHIWSSGNARPTRSASTNGIPRATATIIASVELIPPASVAITAVAGTGEVGEPIPFDPDRYRLQAMEANPADWGEPAPTVVDWPAGTGVVLAEAATCATATAEGVGQVLTAADQLTFFREGDVVYQVFAAGMLPGDAEC